MAEKAKAREFDGQYARAWQDGFRQGRIETFKWAIRKLDRARSIVQARAIVKAEFRRMFPEEYREMLQEGDLIHVLSEDD